MNGVIELMELAQAVMPPFVEVPAKRPCKGAACPLFAICQGRCETKRQERVRQEAAAGR